MRHRIVAAMGRHEADVKATMAAKPEDVWKILVDHARLKEWMSRIKKVDVLSKGPLKDGSKFRVTVGFGDHAWDTTVEVAGFDPPHLLLWEHSDDHFDGQPFDMIRDARTEFALKGSGKATTVSARVGFEPHGFKARLGAGDILNKKFKPMMEDALKALARLAENPR